jgi:DNA-binding response OmpR family regulator
MVVVDPSDKLSSFLTFMVEHCGLDVDVIHLKSTIEAKKAIEEMGAREVKVVIMDTSMVNVHANGDSLPSWMDKRFPNVPVWVNNCEPEREKMVRGLSMRAGVILDGHPVTDFVDILGFPGDARGAAEEYLAG